MMPPTVLLPCVRCLGVERIMVWIIRKCAMLGSIVDTCSCDSVQWLWDADHLTRECALFLRPSHVLVLFAQRLSTCTSFGSHFVGVLVLLEEYRRMDIFGRCYYTWKSASRIWHSIVRLAWLGSGYFCICNVDDAAMFALATWTCRCARPWPSPAPCLNVV